MSKDEILKAGIAAAKSGDLAQAAELFTQVIKIDPSSEQAWLGLGYCQSAPERREYCFRRVLALNPNHRVAREQLARLSQPEQASPPAGIPKVQAAPGVSQPDQTAQRKKKTNTPLIATIAIVSVSILVVSALGLAYAMFYSSLPLGFAANQAAPPGQANLETLATPLPTSSPTPVPPTAIPTAVPTVVYTPVYESMTCPFDLHDASVNCGHLIVPEDRTGDPAHTIKLAVVVYHTRNQNPAPPVVFLQGGPGGAAVQLSADAYDVLVSPFISKHDFIAFDQRGTGLSQPALQCDALAHMYLEDIQGLIEASTRNLVYGNAFRDCNGLMLAQGIKLRAYTTLESAADVRDLLAVLKYRQADLYGASYGTRLAQVVMREYPEIVHTAILDSVVPVDTSLFGNYSDSIAAGLKTLFGDCTNDPQCNTAYPNLETTFWASVKELDAKPVTVTSSNYPAGLITQTVTGETVINTVLGLIKSSRYISLAPQTISRFKGGDFSMLVMEQSSLPFAFNDIAPGLFINMTCHEQVLSTTLAAAQTEANSEIIRNYSWLPFYGSIADVFKTCKSWGATAPAYGENDPTVSAIPSLIITGSFDPTTPPVYAKQIATHLSHSYYFEFPTLGHTPTAADSSGCAMNIVVQFLDNPSAEPDRSCMSKIPSPVFVVPYTGNPPLPLKTVNTYGIKMDVPKDWHAAGGGFYYRGNSSVDITEIGILRLPLSTNNIQDYFSLKAYGYRGLDGPLARAGQWQGHGFNWQLYTSSSYGRPVDIAMVDEGGGSIAVVEFCNTDEHDALYRTVFLPMIDSATK